MGGVRGAANLLVSSEGVLLRQRDEFGPVDVLPVVPELVAGGEFRIALEIVADEDAPRVTDGCRHFCTGREAVLSLWMVCLDV